MKIFEGKVKNGDWGSKHNFLDENDVYVGYDADQDCCENADWFISDKIADKIPEPLTKETILDGWLFDTKFFKETSFPDTDEGGVAIFRITKGDKEKYLHLFNCQNGYYGHGFTMEIKGIVEKKGTL